MDRTNAPGHVNHLFVAENPATNRPPTEIIAQDLNAHQEELINIILAAQMAPDGANNAQVIAALNAMFAKINGATGLIRTLTPAGGARIRELGDIANAATVGGIEFGISYNCNIDPATGVWAGRDVADICWLEKWTDAGGIKEFWYAQNAAAGAVPAWVKVFSLDMVNGTMTLGAAGTSAAHAARVDQLPTPYRNRIINGDMLVSQVNGTSAVTPSTSPTYPIDQWKFGATQPSKLTIQQVADAPVGFKYSTKITVAAQYAPLAADIFQIFQPIEGQNVIDFSFGSAAAKRVAVSLWIKGSVPGTYPISLQNSAGTRFYTGLVTVTNIWALQTVVLDGCTDGAWATDNTVGLFLFVDLGSGANYTGAYGAWNGATTYRTAGSVQFVNQVNGSTLNFTGVQLEKVAAGATTGTDFEFIPYAEQLRRCQRYLPCLNSGGSASILGTGGFISAGLGWAVIPLPVTPRVPVTGIVISSVAHLTLGSVTSPVPASVSISGQGVNCCYLSFSVSGATSGYAADLYFNNASGQIYFTGAQL